jgi:hypothetical protein
MAYRGPKERQIDGNSGATGRSADGAAPATREGFAKSVPGLSGQNQVLGSGGRVGVNSVITSPQHRGHFDLAAGLHPPGQPRSVAAGREAPGSGVLVNHLRPGLYRRREPLPTAELWPGAQAISRPRGNSPSASRDWSDSSAGNHCAESTNVSSAHSPWKANRWTPGCDR